MSATTPAVGVTMLRHNKIDLALHHLRDATDPAARPLLLLHGLGQADGRIQAATDQANGDLLFGRHHTPLSTSGQTALCNWIWKTTSSLSARIHSASSRGVRSPCTGEKATRTPAGKRSPARTRSRPHS